MKRVLIISLILPFAALSQASYFPGVNTPGQAREYAFERMWTKVDVLPEDECRYIFGGRDEALKPGAEIKIGNTAYRYLADTNIRMLHLAVIDFPYHADSRAMTDSLTGILHADFRRHFDFQRLVDHYLRDTEYDFGYEIFYEQSAVLEEMIGGNLQNLRKGELMQIDQSGDEAYRLLIYCKEDPKEVKAGILLQGRID